eukprot:5529853-Amphidinium_carterae.1
MHIHGAWLDHWRKEAACRGTSQCQTVETSMPGKSKLASSFTPGMRHSYEKKCAQAESPQGCNLCTT